MAAVPAGVGAAGATHLGVSGVTGGAAGTASGVTVTAYDTYNNIATGYRGTAGFTSRT